ncbi:MAG: DMT family transporter [Alphaproteobacteria bacterium]|nr:DMT family transporter [Alphaproteobacteria bacterium]
MTATAPNRSLIGIASLCLGSFVFSIQDAIIKAISGDYAVMLAVSIRCCIAFPLLLAMVWYEAGLSRLASRHLGILVLRGFLLLVAYTSYFMALAALPMAEAIALYFTVPVIITLLSWPFLGESVGWRAWLAIIAGFVGILIVLSPGSAVFEPAAFLSLLSATAYSLSMLLARRIGTSEPASVMAFYQNAVYLLFAVLAAFVFCNLGIVELGHPSLDFLVRPWTVPNLADTSLMGACGVIAAVGAWLLTHAYRMAPASLVSVFEYSGIIWVPLWGFLFFAEVPRLTTVIGMVIIVAAGLSAARTARNT